MLMNGWKEAKDMSIKLHEWDADTITKLVQWLYTDDYDNLLPKAFASKSDESRPKGVTDPAIVIIPRPVPGGKKASREVEANLSKISHNRDSCHAFNKARIRDVTPQDSLMAQAKIYAIAEYTHLPGLMRLASERFHLLLDYVGRWPFSETMAENVVDIVEYVYAHTRMEPSSEGEDVLRKHALSFVGENFKYFTGPKAGAMMRKGGDLAADIWSRTTKSPNTSSKRPMNLVYGPRKMMKPYTEAA